MKARPVADRSGHRRQYYQKAAIAQAGRRRPRGPHPPGDTEAPKVDQLLADGRSWIAGAQTSIADFAVYHALWFITARTDRLTHELAPYPRIGAWMTRMRAIQAAMRGYGANSWASRSVRAVMNHSAW